MNNLLRVVRYMKERLRVKPKLDRGLYQIHVDGYKWIHVAVMTILSPIQDVDGDKGYNVSGVNTALRSGHYTT